MFGASVSATSTVIEQAAEFPPASVAVKSKLLLPSANAVGPGSVTASAALQRSDATASPTSTIAVRSPEHSAVTFAGHVIDGGSQSRMSTSAVHVALSCPSLTV